MFIPVWTIIFFNMWYPTLNSFRLDSPDTTNSTSVASNIYTIISNGARSASNYFRNRMGYPTHADIGASVNQPATAGTTSTNNLMPTVNYGQTYEDIPAMLDRVNTVLHSDSIRKKQKWLRDYQDLIKSLGAPRVHELQKIACTILMYHISGQYPLGVGRQANQRIFQEYQVTMLESDIMERLIYQIFINVQSRLRNEYNEIEEYILRVEGSSSVDPIEANSLPGAASQREEAGAEPSLAQRFVMSHVSATVFWPENRRLEINPRIRQEIENLDREQFLVFWREVRQILTALELRAYHEPYSTRPLLHTDNLTASQRPAIDLLEITAQATNTPLPTTPQGDNQPLPTTPEGDNQPESLFEHVPAERDNSPQTLRLQNFKMFNEDVSSIIK